MPTHETYTVTRTPVVGVLGRLWQSVRSYRLGPFTTTGNWPDISVSRSSSTGVTVTEDTALTYSAVWRAVSLISSQVASLPLILYRRTGRGKERYSGHGLYEILHDAPNPEMSSYTFRETLQSHVLCWGNGYAEIERDGAGRVKYLWPLLPSRVSAYRDGAGTLGYRVQRSGGGEDLFTASDILHIPGLGFDGVVGYPVISQAREAIGLGLATERFGGSFFGHGSTFGGAITHPTKFSNADARKNFREALAKRHQGIERAHDLLLLEEGMKFERFGVNPDDAQFLETRKFQVSEIARWFGIPPHMLGDLDRATFSNIEQQALEFLTNCLRPWLVRWEQEINRKLIAPVERRIQFAEHLVEGILRGDIASRYQAYAVGRQWGWLSADDIRERENMNPLPNGSGGMYLVPANMWPADKVPDPTQVAPTPEAPGESSEEEDDLGQRALALLEAQLHTASTEATAARADAETARLERVQAVTAAGVSETARAEAEARERAAREVAEAATQREAELRVQLDILTEIRATVLEAQAADRVARQEAEQRAAAATQGQALAEAARVAAEQRVDQADRDLAIAQQVAAAADGARAAAVEAAQARVAAQLPAHRALITDAMGRLVRREVEKARRHQATPQKLLAWLETFSVLHEPVAVEVLEPAIRAHLALIGSVEDARGVVLTIVRHHLGEFQRQLRSVVEVGPEEYLPRLAAVLERWEQHRPAAVSDALLEEGMAYVRSR